MKKYFSNLIIFILTVLIVTFYIFYKNKQTNKKRFIEEKKLIVGTSADYQPFSFRDNSDNIVGFDIDIVKEVAKRINYKIDIVDRQFSMLLPQIQMGQIQIIAAGMTSTEERRNSVRFTEPYINNNNLVLVSLLDKKIDNLKDLINKKVIVNTGYVSDSYLSSLPESKDINIIRLSKVEDAILALDNNKADFFLTSKLILKPYLKNKKYNIFNIENSTESFSLAVSKSVPEEIFKKIENAIKEMKKDGTLKNIKKKWDL